VRKNNVGAKSPPKKGEMRHHERRKKWTEVNEIVHRYTRHKIREYVFRIFLETTGGWGTDPSKHFITKYQKC